MKSESPLLKKTYDFALQVVPFCTKLMENKREYVMSKQLLRSGTGVGASVEEAQQAQSKPDFVSKLSIALKEAVESRYWLRLLRDTEFALPAETNLFIEKMNEIIKMLVASINTVKRNRSS